MRKRIMSLLAALAIMFGVALAPAAPAQAAITACGTNICLADTVSSSDFTYPPNYPRNMCIDVSVGANIEVYDNSTNYRWYGFHTSACSGSHIEFPPGWDGGMLGTFGSSWDGGALHGIYRTSSTS